MSDFLGIDLIAGLSENKSKTEINKVIKKMNDSGQFNNLKLDLKIDDKVINSIKGLRTELEKISKVAEQTGIKIKDAFSTPESKKVLEEAKKIKSEYEKQAQAAENKGKRATKANEQEVKSVKNLEEAYKEASRIRKKYEKDGTDAGQQIDIKSKDGYQTDRYRIDPGSDKVYKTETVQNLEKEQKDIENIKRQRQNLYNQLADIERKYGADKQKIAQFIAQVDRANINNYRDLKRNIDQYTVSLQNAQKLENAQRRHRERVYKLDSQLVGTKSKEHRNDLTDLGLAYQKLTPYTKNLDQELKRLDSTFNRLSTDIIKADQGMARFSRQLASAMVRVPIYAATMAGMYAPLRMFQDAVSQSIAIDSQMTVLERVSNGTIQMNRALEDSIGIAERLGNTIHEVNDGLINFARQGYRGDELAAMTEYATVMSNVSDLSVEESASSLTAAMKGFNIEAENSLHIVNAMNEVDRLFVPYTSNSIRKSRICWKVVIQSLVVIFIKKLVQISNNLKNRVIISRDSPKFIIK